MTQVTRELSSEQSSDDTPRQHGFSAESSEAWLDGLLEEFEQRWERGERPRAEDYLNKRWNEADAVALIYHEYCLTESAGALLDVDAFLSRFPDYRPRLSRLIGFRELIARDSIAFLGHPQEADWPVPGDEIGPYQLLRSLGSGSFARVFLASQTNLSDRLIVLKLTRRHSPEPELLARARHPHIVDVLSHAKTGDGAYHLICMPYLGGTTLSVLLDELRSMRPRTRPTSGRAWLALLDRMGAPEECESSRASPARQLIARMRHPQVMVWMIARLAEALDLAHRRGVYHGDVKPSNVLVAADGRPMLLDFNLAIERGEGSPIELGGTLAYMSPERLLRIAEPADDASPTESGRAKSHDPRRADLYALGLLLQELLTEELPGDATDLTNAAPLAMAARLAIQRGDAAYARLAQRHCLVPLSLRPVLARCLASNPNDRYARGAELAHDLDRWIAHSPFEFAAQPVWQARFARWGRRNASWLGITVVVVVMALGAAQLARHLVQHGQERIALAKITALWSGREPGIFRFRWAGSWRKPEASEVAEVARRVLDQYEVIGPHDWRMRDDVCCLPPEHRVDLELWLLEHTWKYAMALGQRSTNADSHRAVAVLEIDRHWAELEPIREARARLNGPQSRSTPVTSRPRDPSPSALEFYLKGLELESSHARAALEQFQLVARRIPTSFWANYRVASCASRLGRYGEAAKALNRCLESVPDNPALLTQLAACLMYGQDFESADRLLQRVARDAPDFSEAYRTRAILHAFRGQVGGTTEDRDLFRWLSGRTHAIKRWDLDVLLDYALLEEDSTQRNRTEDAPRITGYDPDDAVTYALRGCLAEWDRRWQDAIAEYTLALNANPDHLWALYRRGQVRSQLGNMAGLRDYQSLVAHDRFDELVGQWPASLLVYSTLVSDLISESSDTNHSANKQDSWSRARDLARSALARARLSGEKEFVVDMECLVARSLVATANDKCQVSAEAANHLRSAAALLPDRVERILRCDRHFTLWRPLPDWVPRFDPIRRWFPFRDR